MATITTVPSSEPSTPILAPDGPVVTNGHGNGNGNPLQSVDPSVFRSYLLALLPPVLGASLEDLEDTLFDEEFNDRVVKFASDGGGVIYVVKTRIDAEGTSTASNASITSAINSENP